ncbi:MAG: purine-nucleoside phosphorylase [Oscillospiraceae bacterium]|nr:purine-nucleoside phosphorylase [Oscillospiraceae bacterium]
MLQSPSSSIYADPEAIAKVVLFPGDPLRAKTLAETYLEKPVLFNSVRNMLGYTGLYRGRRVSVMGSGMGVPSATLYAHELYNFYGVESILRIGTAGGLASDVLLRDIVIASTASTNSHYCDQYAFPGLLAPAADFSLLRRAVEAAEAAGKRVRVGGVFTTDSFYNAAPAVNEKSRDFGLLAVEMETAGLYWEAMASHKRALSILSISDHLFSPEQLTSQERQDSLRDMMEIALDTAWTFAE